ncbi:MAG: hypothetical protein QOG16_512 [Actinomycetota bacterium]|jgi:hypothetical protein|nr:hypothetical protein [Actinomycetota bacterium]
MVTKVATMEKDGLARELSQSLVLLALTGASVGGILGMLSVATRALGR